MLTKNETELVPTGTEIVPLTVVHAPSVGPEADRGIPVVPPVQFAPV
jgi:hypothetical protein